MIWAFGIWVLGLAVDLERIHALDRQLFELQQKLHASASRTRELSEETAQAEVELSALRVTAQSLGQTFSGRLRALMRLPQSHLWALLESGRGLSDYVRGFRLIRALARHDRTILDAHKTAAAALTRELSLSAQRQNERAQLETALVEEQARLASRRAERLLLWQKLNPDDFAAWEDARQAAFRQVLSRSGSRELAGPTRSKTRPVQGELVRGFGPWRDPVFQSTVLHSGQLYRTATGTSVRASAAGRIAYANWLDGFGLSVLVEHGQGWHSFYAQLGEISVKDGDTVAEGTRLGEVGQSSVSHEVGMYFEVRQNGAPVDPEIWWKRGR